jgi:hypothetical protein
LYGVLYNKAISNSYYLGTREEVNIVAKPFSFDFPSDTAPTANYVWYVNGNYIAPGSKTNEMLFRQTVANLKGTTSVSLDLKSTINIFQSASNGFSVGFGQ